MEYTVDNVKNFSATRGWICGHFLPEGSPLRNTELEVKYSVLQPGETQAAHVHPHGTEVSFVIHGKMKYRVGGKEFLLSDGDFVFMKANVEEAILEVYEPTTMVSVRTPSVPGNKVMQDA